ncbi:serine O-acetyltransferase [Paraferrimonas sp. SM1919]|uniref:serine O-acetyltransferase n=1 Tax=Paraferrimonas sp. SM1919 TaxID=2662263 RepID=UPI0013D70246|nr:serine O-acetyltransferase [Paraferrimonas sp. SM1919]
MTISSFQIWQSLHKEAGELAGHEDTLASFFHTSILNHNCLSSALSYLLAIKLGNDTMPAIDLRELFKQAYAQQPELVEAAAQDIVAVRDRDPAISDYCSVLLYLKGYHAIQCHRIAHCLWSKNRKSLAIYLQSRVSERLGVDIHPAARIGKGVMFDHATGIVIGETCVIEDNVSIMQSVTLGGTGNESGDRHPKIRQGVMIGAGAKVLGNIEVGTGAKVGAGSVVLKDVAPHTTVAGIPAKIMGSPCSEMPALDMKQNIFDD